MNFFLTLLVLLWVYMTVWFVISLWKKRNDVADVAWGLGFVLMAWASLVLAPDNPSVRALLVTGLVSVWGIRLAWHIGKRHIGKPEDFRYATWRQTWGKWFVLRSYGQIYLLQGFLLFLVVSPVLVINHMPGNSWSWLDGVGFFVWCLGFFFEAVGDAQLASFIRNPENKGKLMQSGLWSLTRHPNYFGEVTQWWGIWIMALSVPFGALAIVGPVVITLLILKVSGVPLLEKKMAEHPDFARYQARTNMFFPGLPKKIV